MSPRARAIAYWAITIAIALEMIAGAAWDLARIRFVRDVFAHLGYPLYLLTILGVAKLPCAIVWLAPGWPRLKEWAYAGAVINYAGAAASHAFAGDGPKGWAGPIVFALMTLASWALRPADRKLASSRPASARVATSST